MADKDYRLFVGGYTDGSGQGIMNFQLDAGGILSGGNLAARSTNPSYLAVSHDGTYLLAVNEVNEDGQGSVESYAIHGDTLSFLSRRSSGGAHPCFVAVNDHGYVLIANYTGGTIALLKLNDTGLLSEAPDIRQHYGRGTTERQQAPHAHSAWFVPNSSAVISADLGTNKLNFYQLDETNNGLSSISPDELKLEDGAGPRHLCFHPNGKWIYVANELNSTVTQIDITEMDTAECVASYRSIPADFREMNHPGHIELSPDGAFLYVSNRGHNSVALFTVDKEDGHPELLSCEPVRGVWPRHFSLSPDGKFLVVANQRSESLSVFRRDAVTGKLTFSGSAPCPSPSCICFQP